MSNVTISEVLLGEQVLKLEAANESLQAQVTQLTEEREVAVERVAWLELERDLLIELKGNQEEER